MRYPVTYHEVDISKALAAAVPAGSQITIVRSMPLFCMTNMTRELRNSRRHMKK